MPPSSINQNSEVNNILDSQLTNTINEYETINEDNIAKSRLIDINTYYTERYRAHISLMKIIILVSLPLLIIFILRTKEILSDAIAITLGSLVLLIGLIIIGYRIFELYLRNNMNYNEFDEIYYDPIEQANIDSQKGIDIGSELKKDFSGAISNLESNLEICIGAACCSSDQVYNGPTKKCISKNGNLITSSSNESWQEQGIDADL